jgi:hypothetical protein
MGGMIVKIQVKNGGWRIEEQDKNGRKRWEDRGERIEVRR